MIREHARKWWLGLGALAVLAALATLGAAMPASAGDASGGSADALTAFPGANWATTGGDLANSRYSTLTQITRGNVKNLVRAWNTPIDPGQQTGPVESPPTGAARRMYPCTKPDRRYAT